MVIRQLIVFSRQSFFFVRHSPLSLSCQRHHPGTTQMYSEPSRNLNVEKNVLIRQLVGIELGTRERERRYQFCHRAGQSFTPAGH
jgi:hypothetical protein